MHQSRRNFLRGRGDKASLIRPPWTLSEATFLEKCSRCDDCIRGCEEKILVRGDGGFPVVRFDLGECTFCGACRTTCSEGVFVVGEAVQPWQHKVEIQPGCIVYKGVVCMTCRDQCEPRAIRFTPQLGGLSPPLLDAALCTGCGACIAPCPSGAIQVTTQRG